MAETKCSVCGENETEDPDEDFYECRTCHKTNLCDECCGACDECEDITCHICLISFDNAENDFCKSCIDKVYPREEKVVERVVENIVEVPKETIKVMGFSEPIL